jgi:hypothetical protein
MSIGEETIDEQAEVLRRQDEADDSYEIHEVARLMAGLVVKELRGSVISSSFPAEIGGWIRQTAEHHALLWTHTIPMRPSGTCILTDWRLNPDGTLQLELRDSNGMTFWRGTFRPEETS